MTGGAEGQAEMKEWFRRSPPPQCRAGMTAFVGCVRRTNFSM